jgi:DNA processing protein
MINLDLLLLNMSGFEPKKVMAIMEAFDGGIGFHTASRQSLLAIDGVNDNDVDFILRLRDSDALKREIELINDNGFKVISLSDAAYPPLLREIANPPLVLYVRGDVSILSEFSLGVIGSRECSSYGINCACELSRKLARCGVVVVSGLARGIDTAAHTGALAGRTVAVLGSGLLNIYPRENKPLCDDIALKGAVVSEFPLNTAPDRDNFPRRNRIISGLSKGVVVVEAAMRSGALITARLAMEQNREVFAVPGRMNSHTSEGTNQLIKDGAKLVDSVEDILLEFDLTIESVNNG